MTDLDAATYPLTENGLIEASAGTGKTYTITNLVLRLLLGRGREPLPINQVLVLTFTIAAADELKHRIANRIIDARNAYRHGSEDPFLAALVSESEDTSRDTRLLRAASQMMDEASIFTIHGFCARVLGELAFESGILFDQDLNAERDELLQLAAEDYFRSHVLPLAPPARELALSLWQGPRELAQNSRGYLFREGLYLYPENLAPVDPDELIGRARGAMSGWVAGNLEAVITAADLKKRNNPVKRLPWIRSFFEADHVDLVSDNWSVYSQETLRAAMKKSSTMPEHPVLDDIDAIHRDIESLKAWFWYDSLLNLRQHIERQKQDGNKQTLDDLLIQTCDAVTRPGSRLPSILAERWPVALIDEFQDTDNIQYDIFRTVYPGATANQAFFMIGDPKQAIYSFRGADVFTYINARRSSKDIQTLSVNWRSTPSLVDATNHLFQRKGLFGNDADIPFKPASAAEQNRDKQITINGDSCPPYHLFVTGNVAATTNTDVALEEVMDYAAEEVVRLIGSDNETLIDGEPVDAGQIAFLVRRRKHARAAQLALQRRGIKSVYLTIESVFLQDTAYDLGLILQAVADPTSDRAVRAALACRLVQASAGEIHQLDDDITAHQRVLTEFREYHETWLTKNVAAMLNQLMNRRQLANKWLKQPDGERQLTNLRHLIELLQKRAIQAPGIFQLIKWFRAEQVEAESVDLEERQLRLESDENLVKIVTMHAAKGIEYDIVMIPMPVFGKHPYSGPVLFHKSRGSEYVAAMDLAKEPHHKKIRDEEERHEEMRLLYVALTRARYRCYIGVPKTKNLAKSAFAELLGLELSGKDYDLVAEMKDLELPGEGFEIQPVTSTSVTQFQASTPVEQPAVNLARPETIDNWRMHSYTGFASRFAEPHAITGFRDDDDVEDEPQANTRNRFSFRKGPRIGVALHSMLEDLDFTSTEQHNAICSRTIRRLGLEPEWLPVLEDWLVDILATPLGDIALNQVSTRDRLDEMEFHFPLSGANLIPFLNKKGYLSSGPAHVRLEGMMTGLIDLLFRHNGKFYIVDYKSNHLGNGFDAYTSDRLAEAMVQHHYPLQYLIYTTAVHRMLKRQLPSYDYDEHFGGVYYLFLRGMKGTGETGVYRARPAAEEILQFDELLGGAP